MILSDMKTFMDELMIYKLINITPKSYNFIDGVAHDCNLLYNPVRG